ncbi:hypothetical protein MKZ38_002874 [Zalerion maritima]|uniref:Uncharacterized protein n=1 Tax=Zalerion maritima TaxID=339359 RepID=A0AAD5WX83_9PEZI|nr:hypothetical protein MKZ38_002874 [Zalerion maritima]
MSTEMFLNKSGESGLGVGLNDREKKGDDGSPLYPTIARQFGPWMRKARVPERESTRIKSSQPVNGKLFAWPSLDNGLSDAAVEEVQATRQPHCRGATDSIG